MKKRLTAFFAVVPIVGDIGYQRRESPLSFSVNAYFQPRLCKNDGTIFKFLAIFIAIRVEEPKARC